MHVKEWISESKLMVFDFIKCNRIGEEVKGGILQYLASICGVS